MRPAHAAEAALIRGLSAAVRVAPWRRTLAWGVHLGDAVRALGIRRRVAEANLALAFPEKSDAQRAEILRLHYRELGRAVVEYARLGELARSPEGEVLESVVGVEHLLAARDAGRGAILLSGHFGNVELLGSWLGRLNPVDLLVKPLSNPGVEALLSRERARAGVGQIPIGPGVRRAFAALRANRWVAILADQDARRHGVFVPFFGRLASTPTGPAEIALRTGAPIIMGFDERLPDGRHRLRVLPPLVAPPRDDPDAVRALTALHTAELEAQVRARPEMWFWLHRRWKTAPP